MQSQKVVAKKNVKNKLEIVNPKIWDEIVKVANG
jgi:hypothetical protein